MRSEPAVENRPVRGRRRKRGNESAEGPVPAFEAYLPWESQWFMFGVGWVLIAAFVLLCRWVEEVAARKKPRLPPGGGPARMGP